MTSAVLASGRAAAEALMRDACTVTRSSKGEWSDELGDYEPGTVTTVYSGMCRVVAENVAAREVQAGEQEVTIVSWRVSVPVSVATGDIGEGDVVEVTASVNDPALVGRRFMVAGPFAGSDITARRIPVRAVV